MVGPTQPLKSVTPNSQWETRKGITMSHRMWHLGVVTTGMAALALTGCTSSSTSTSGKSDKGSSSGTLTVGTTDKVVALDPAGSYDNGSLAVESQVYPFLMNSKPGSAKPEPDIAASAKFTSPHDFTVKLKKGLKFANGHDLTSSDVKFSFDRQVKIADPDGPSSLLSNLEKVSTPDDLTVVFHLKGSYDQTWPGVLTSSAGPIVDEQVLSPTKLTPDKKIVDANAFAGPFKIVSYSKNSLISYKKFDGYKGILPAAKTSTINMKYYSDANNLKLDIGSGNIDMAYRTLSPTDIASLSKNKNVKIHKGPGGELRYMVFNFNTMPFGKKTKNPDPEKALAVRQAMADSINRKNIAKQVYKNTYQPVYSFVPEGFAGQTQPLKKLYGDGQGGPDPARAKQRLKKAGVKTPVTIHLQYNSDHYGSSSSEEYAMIKSQLEATGLFKVDLQSTEWVQYSKDRVKDEYPVYQLGWYPDYSDADNYMTPFFLNPGSFLSQHFMNEDINKLIKQQRSEPDAQKRNKLLGELQLKLGKLLPTLPFLQGAQVAVAGKDVKGVTLDPSFKLHLSTLHKS